MLFCSLVFLLSQPDGYLRPKTSHFFFAPSLLFSLVILYIMALTNVFAFFLNHMYRAPQIIMAGNESHTHLEYHKGGAKKKGRCSNLIKERPSCLKTCFVQIAKLISSYVDWFVEVNNRHNESYSKKNKKNWFECN